MSYTINHNINHLIQSCGGYMDFRDIILLENCKSKDRTSIAIRIRERHSRRKQKGYKNIK